MKAIVILLILSLSSFVYSIDEVYNLPDYPVDAKMHSGYLDLKNPHKKLHYVLVHSESNPETDPLVLWLNGGPGCSSLDGFSLENGPARLIYGQAKWQVNPYSWHKKANMLYIESPAGVGFSYIDSDDPVDIKSDDVKSGQDNLEAVINFFDKYPNFRNRDFYISGESYAGIYIPYLAANIIKHNKSQNSINLKGILIGNGVTDWSVDAENATPDFAYNHALYGSDLREKYLENCINNTNEEACEEANAEISRLLNKVNPYYIYEQCSSKSVLGKGKGQINDRYKRTPWFYKNKNPHSNSDELRVLFETKNNLRDSLPSCNVDAGFEYFDRLDVRKALNVKIDLPNFEVCSGEVGANYNIDRTKGSLFLYKEILLNSGIRIWKFSGDADAVVAFNGTEKWIRNLNLPVVEEWRSWHTGDPSNIGGYVTKYNKLSFVTVRGAGHMVPQFRPAEAYYMFTQFINGNDL